MERKTFKEKHKQVNLASFYQVVNAKNKRKQQEIQEEHDRVIKEIFGDGPIIGEDDGDDLVQEDEPATSLELIPKCKKQRRWRPAWKYEHKWAYPVVVEGKLRIKCEWCAYAKNKSQFAIQGSTTIQLPALNEHNKSGEHKMAALKWENKNNRVCIPLPEYVATFEDKEKVRIITVMWQLYFVVRCAGPMELFEKLCLHQIEQGLPNMPKHVDYGTFLNRKSGMEFLQAIRDVLWDALCKEIQASPWYSLMVDDSTDRGKEGHFYVSYLKDGGKGDNNVVFARLLKTEDGSADAKYDAIMKLLREMGLCLQKLVALAADGCSVMMGCRRGLAARMKVDVPHLLSVHCLAHRENLAASQAVGSFPEFVYLDKLCKSIYTWLHASGKRMDDLRLVEGALDIPELSMLRIHSVRWLSLGQVMERMVKIMPALLVEFAKEKPSIYDDLMIYAIQFCIHLLADVCTELNVLSRHLQSDLVDIANISGYAEATLRNLERKFLRDSTKCGTKYLQKFVEQTQNGAITFYDVSGDLHIHTLKFDRIEGSSRGGSLNDCMHLAKELVEKITQNLIARMEEDMYVFDACKIFSPKNYPSEELEMNTFSKAWLEKLLSQYGSLVDVEKIMGEMDAFTMVLASNFKHKSLRDAWDVCKDDITMRDSFPNMTMLWEIISVVPVNTAMAERGFSLQNTIKIAHRASMDVTTLENYMFIGLHGPANTSDVPWDDVFDVWSKKKNRCINTAA